MIKALTILALSLTLATAKSPFKGKQSTIHGLLVSQTSTGGVAGFAAEMNATLIKQGDGPFKVKFNQKTGKLMSGATKEVQKFISVQHNTAKAKGHIIELSFANKHSPKDGPSAAVACALMVDSVVTGDELIPEVAVTGDLTATGKVRPVGGIKGKVRGAIKKKCVLVAIPIDNVESVSDISLNEGLKPLYSIPIFSIETFDEAKALSIKNRSKKIQSALDEFALVQGALAKNEGFVRNPKVIEKLRKIIDLTPNNLSAKYLLLHGIGKPPTSLSLNASLDFVNESHLELNQILKSKDVTGDKMTRYIFELPGTIKILDARARPYAQKYLDVAKHIRKFESKGKIRWTEQQSREFKSELEELYAERDRLFAREDVVEELGTE